MINRVSSGIGHELARRYAADGYELFICSDTGEIETAAQLLRNEGAAVGNPKRETRAGRISRAFRSGPQNALDSVSVVSRPSPRMQPK